MCDEWMPVIELPLTGDQFLRLPRNAAFKYELIEGRVVLSPRPRHYHAMLDLAAAAAGPAPDADDGFQIRPVTAPDFPYLELVFAAAFHRAQPFASLDDAARQEAARRCLERTRTGGDGPWVEQASFAAVTAEGGRPVGAIFITLLPAGDPRDWDSYYWDQPPPADCVARRLGRAHLTWIFVGPLHAGRGVGTALLGAAARALVGLGYGEMASTFLLGNESSMLWHWRNGFRLLPYPTSKRLMRERLRAKS